MLESIRLNYLWGESKNTKYTAPLQFRRWRISEHLCMAPGCVLQIPLWGRGLCWAPQAGQGISAALRKAATGLPETFFQKCSKFLCLVLALIVEKQAFSLQRGKSSGLTMHAAHNSCLCPQACKDGTDQSSRQKPVFMTIQLQLAYNQQTLVKEL